ncbi:GNAT family N-acetyltransferase [Isoptericola sp. BMS4]|uniref:GNAT family N-acetyltransferase n=1 Tax=Isoptericola sp. BMS4 TaxID=2527875 RepID=UPI001420D87F|nr:GNAT family N-acetyltransferase [Isoptericola sp. BMS4]
MQIITAPLDELDPRTAFDVCRLRQDVFVVEQRCAYPDLDDRDLEPATRHVVLRDGARVVATARVLDDGAEQRIGRVVCHQDVRGTGASGALMRAALDAATAAAPSQDVVLGAQSPLVDWYGRFGFEPDGPEYLEDDIPHTPMRLRR